MIKQKAKNLIEVFNKNTLLLEDLLKESSAKSIRKVQKYSKENNQPGRNKFTLDLINKYTHTNSVRDVSVGLRRMPTYDYGVNRNHEIFRP